MRPSNDTVWSAQDTTPGEVEAALRRLLVERHNENDGYVPARVLNLVCIVDRAVERRDRQPAAPRRALPRLAHDRLRGQRGPHDDRRARVGRRRDATPTDGEHVLTHETVILDLGPGHLEHLETIVDPLVITDLTTLVWAPHGHWQAVEALRGLSQCVLLDSTEDPDVAGALRRAQALLADRYVVDLAWLRSTPWRERIAMLFDPPAQRARLREITALRIRNAPESGAAALLLCGWLRSRLGWRAGAARARRPRPLDRDDGRRSRCALESVRLDVPGLEGVTLRLPRRRRAVARPRRRRPAGDEPRRRAAASARWTLLGASRGEGGILGEGMRQSLLRDPTYREALDAAAAMLT